MIKPNAPPSRAAHSPPGSLMALVLPYLWPRDEPSFRRRIVLAFAALIAAKLVNIATPFFLKHVVDSLSVQTVAAIPLAALLGYGAARLGAGLFRELRDALFARVGYRAGRKVALETYRHIFGLSLRYHLERRSGELARAIDRGVAGVNLILETVLFSLLPTVLEFVLVVGVLLLRYPPVYAIITGLTIVAYAVFTFVTTEWRSRFRRQMNERNNEFNAIAVDGLINYEVVKAFGNEGYEARRLDRSLEGYENAAVKSQTSLAFLNAGQASIVAIGLTLLMLIAARGVVAGTLTVGDVVLLNTFLLQLYVPLGYLGVVYRQLKQSLIDLEIIRGLRARQPEVEDSPGARPLAVGRGSVRFEHVGFAYDPRRPVLFDLSFDLPAGRKLALVGASGAGKSTIVKLLFRFYDPTSGRISIEQQDIKGVTQASLHSAIGLVPQDTVLFNDTIAANIGYGRPDATLDEIEEAARIAQIHGFISRLPDGYDTIVGERGLKLSGGEKQRIAIARVVLKDPPILVLDEATSALDTHTEQTLQEALARAAAGRTTLVIAHRLSTVVDADKIIVLQDGRAVERGTHAELLARDGVYASMWRRQRADALLEETAG
jgi:ATP-binding cassette, subfamily B, heavy metal transporter